MNNNQATINKMAEMRLHGMAQAFRTLQETGNNMERTTDEAITYLIDSEWDEKHNRRLARLMRAARFRYKAAIEEIDFGGGKSFIGSATRRASTATPSPTSWMTFLEIPEDRHRRKSTIVISQQPVENWHGIIGDPTMADAIMDRLAFHSHGIEITGDTVRRKHYAVD
jgi:DNA replication protein DnaC